MRALRLPLLLLHILPGLQFAIAAPEQHVFQLADQRPLGTLDDGQKPLPGKPESHTLPAFLDALDVLQVEYFAVWQGIWPTGIDWTSAVIGTYVSASLSTISTSFTALSSKSKENLVNKYFSQLVASYFGQDAFALRQEAYDDMLWVVLGWLESIKFINKHSELHYSDELWHGTQWIPAFAHRARIFWDMASQGWDTSLCSGGMIWSPYLEPYKNAITNELFIAASISMYLYFPGDDNTSPFSLHTGGAPGKPKDPKYLAAAVDAYKWLKNSNMTDNSGLYVDGYHISGYNKNNSSGNTRCDARNEMVYTYNQGVLLSGQRGLYEATGAKSYLEDGHALVENVLAATGWDISSQSPLNSSLTKWYGLGRHGVLEDTCDARGYCSQDGQTFKGIFFHHLTLFCDHLPEHLVIPEDGTFSIEDEDTLAEIRKWHDAQCGKYGSWIRHNANAALSTKDDEGKFGMWWGAPSKSSPQDGEIEVEIPEQAVDYRNQGVPEEWGKRDSSVRAEGKWIGVQDLNDRGRGRTLETQGGGVAVLRALWEVVDGR